jgi:PadR family transcriptional regulator, regulatory protein PadR
LFQQIAMEAMEIENNKNQMKRGVLELCVLLALQADEAYPSDVLETLQKTQLNIPEGTLYPILTRLKNAGYLTYRWVESTEGPPRKYFSLTAEGTHHLNNLQIAWQDLVKSVQLLITKQA